MQKMKEKDLIKAMENTREDTADTETAIAKGIENLNNPRNINLLTDLSSDEIRNLIVVETIGELYNDKMRLQISKLYKELKVSKGRKGRKEIIDVVKAGKESDINQGLLQRLRL